jgi:hypothetical protein
MKDFIGRELAEGDFVAMMLPGYRSLVLGKIVKFTPKKVRVAYTYQRRNEDTAVDPRDLVKLDGPDFTTYLLKLK